MVRSFVISRPPRLCSLRPTWYRLIAVIMFLSIAAPPFVEWQVTSLSAAELSDEEAVTTGADALDSWWNYPWYDSSKDTLRRIDVKQQPLSSTSSGSSGSLDGLQWLGWTLIAVLLAFLAYLLIRGYLNRENSAAQGRFHQPPGTLAGVDRLEDLPFLLEAPVDDLHSAARRAGEAGDYGRAIVYLYSHQLIELDKQQRIRLTKGKTNRQYVRELVDSAALSQMLRTTMIAFEDVFFGSQRLDRERFEECWSLTEALSRPQLQEAA